MTLTIERPVEPPPRPATVARPAGRGRRRGWLLLGVLAVWIAGWAVLRGRDTLELPNAELTGLHTWFNSVRDSFDAHRTTSFLLNDVVGGITDALNRVITALQHLLSQPPAGRPVPQIGWLGVVALLAWCALALAGWRAAVLVAACTLSFGFLGYWATAIDTLIVTFVAVVICVVIGLPLGIWMARSKRATTVITPVLDLMQTLPSFAYLAPLALVFGIGPAAAIVTTLIYALPPLVRITAHGIRTVSPATVEAARSFGSSGTQALRKVQLPMARRTIIVGVNQCTMAALSMVTIATLINGPGLGEPVLQALQSLDIGAAFVSGLAIVLMAIMLDRATTAAGERTRSTSPLRLPGGPPARPVALAASGAAALVAVYLSHQYLWAAQFPAHPDVGTPLARNVSRWTDSLVNSIDSLTTWLKDVTTNVAINPLESLLARSPWWLVALALLAIAYLLGGRRPLLTTALCEGVILGTGLWNESMKTLTTSLVATVLVVIVAVVLGVVMGRMRLADSVIRPFLDGLQTIPPFVYLVPALALFGPTRFTAIVAAFAYGVPIATKLVADGIKGVSATTVEAAASAGTNSWQMIAKVQLPMARAAVVLAVNQGLLYVLSMVVVGGLVGGGGLGYLVVSGFSQGDLFGKGLAAGIAITALGIMLDRIAQHTAARYGRV